MADLRIDLAAEWRGAKAFKQADTSITGLYKKVDRLGKSLGIALGTAQLIRFGKESVKAFAADEAATIRLANAVKNLGYEYAQPEITNFIKNLEISSGIVDDKLRPAFQALLTTTKDLNSSYILLNDAITISRGSGVDLATVAEDLAKGYVGITRGLRKYNTGLTQSELKTKSFTEVLQILNKQFAGANAAYLDTYSYKLDVLSVAAENAKEVIGKGLIDAFARAGGGSDVQDAVKTIDNIAKAINGITQAVGLAIGALTKLYRALDFITSFGGLFGENSKLGKAFRPEKFADDTKKAAAASKTLVMGQIKASKEVVKSNKALTAEQKKQAALKKLGTVFDMDQIQLVAALKGKLSQEDEIRAKAQLALLAGNVDEAKRLTDLILQAQDSSGNLARFLAALPDARNPFKYLDDYLSYLQGKAAALSVGTPFGQAPIVNQPPASSTITNPSPVLPSPSAPDFFQVLSSQGAGASGGFSSIVSAAMSATSAAAPVVNVTVQGSIVSQAELIDAIVDATQVRSLSGSPSQIGRIQGMFGG